MDGATARRITRRNRDLAPARGIAMGIALGMLAWAILLALWWL
jgi:hypothetical protein